MRGKINVKTVIVMVILLLVGVLSVLGVGAVQQYVSGAAGGSDPKGVLATPGSDGKTGVIVWSSDKASQGVVEYGTTPASLLLRSLETDAVTDHKITLSPLKPNTSYYFRIRVGDQIFDNSGIPYSFKTKTAAVEADKSVVAPTIAKPTTPVNLPTTASGGSCDRITDYNGDGVVNSVDFVKCMNPGKGTVKPTAPVVSGSKCSPSNDFDGNGVVNSLDLIKCLQSQK